MITAVDTNILLDLARPNPAFVDNAVALLERAGSEGRLVISTIVHAEVAAHFPDKALLNRFLGSLEIDVDTFTTESTWLASRAWINYRRQGGKRERILSDFLVGAHAQIQAGRLLTRDRGFYRSYFEPLSVVEKPGDFT